MPVKLDGREVHQAEQTLLAAMAKAFPHDDAATILYAFGRVYGTMLATHKVVMSGAVLEPIISSYGETRKKMAGMSDEAIADLRRYAAQWLKDRNEAN
jgi:hypothetical protein